MKKNIILKLTETPSQSHYHTVPNEMDKMPKRGLCPAEGHEARENNKLTHSD